MNKLKKGDTIEVIAGRDKGSRGKVIRVFPDKRKILVEGVFVQKRHMKAGASQTNPNGGIIEKPAKIDMSNVMFYSEKLQRAVRVGIDVKPDGTRVRVARGQDVEAVELD